MRATTPSLKPASTPTTPPACHLSVMRTALMRPAMPWERLDTPQSSLPLGEKRPMARRRSPLVTASGAVSQTPAVMPPGASTRALHVQEPSCSLASPSTNKTHEETGVRTSCSVAASSRANARLEHAHATSMPSEAARAIRGARARPQRRNANPSTRPATDSHSGIGTPQTPRKIATPHMTWQTIPTNNGGT